MSQKRRVEKLEQAAGRGGEEHDIVIEMCWGDGGAVPKYYLDGKQVQRWDIPAIATGTAVIKLDWLAGSD